MPVANGKWIRRNADPGTSTGRPLASWTNGGRAGAMSNAGTTSPENSKTMRSTPS